MLDPMRRLRHSETPESTDETRRAEAKKHLGNSPPLQFVAELMTKLRAMRLEWWTNEQTCAMWPALDRMQWFMERPDLRQRIVTNLTGLPANTARTKSPAFQAELLVAVMDAGDLSMRAFDESFDPSDMVVYGPSADFWARFRERMPWEDASPMHRDLVAWTLRALLSSRSTIEGCMRKPILSPWDVRANIDTRTWNMKVPLDVRVAIDDARLRLERNRPRDPYTTRDELTIATPDILAEHVPFADLAPVFSAAERALGFDHGMAERDSMRPSVRSSMVVVSGSPESAAGDMPPPSVRHLVAV